MKFRNLAIIALMSATSPVVLATSAHAETATPAATEWWPKNVDLSALRQHEAQANPYGADFDYAKEFASLDLAEVKRDIAAVAIVGSQPFVVAIHPSLPAKGWFCSRDTQSIAFFSTPGIE